MNIFLIISYLNKISLLAFVVTAFFLGYQFYLFKKESSVNKNKTPKIPNFNENENINILNFTKLPENLTSDHQIMIKKNDKPVVGFIVGAGLLILTLGVFIIIKSQQTKQISQVIELTPTTKPIILISKYPNKKLLNTITPTTIKNITITPSPSLKIFLSITPSPTEVVVALISPTVDLTPSVSSTKFSPTTISNLPVTGIIDQSFILFGVAASFILFSFVF